MHQSAVRHAAHDAATVVPGTAAKRAPRLWQNDKKQIKKADQMRSKLMKKSDVAVPQWSNSQILIFHQTQSTENHGTLEKVLRTSHDKFWKTRYLTPVEVMLRRDVCFTWYMIGDHGYKPLYT